MGSVGEGVSGELVCSRKKAGGDGETPSFRLEPEEGSAKSDL